MAAGALVSYWNGEAPILAGFAWLPHRASGSVSSLEISLFRGELGDPLLAHVFQIGAWAADHPLDLPTSDEAVEPDPSTPDY